MSDPVGRSYNDCDGRAGQSVHSYQSVWMAHWTRTSCNAAPQMHNLLSPPFGNKEDEHDTKQHQLLGGVEMETDISRSAKGFRDLEAKTFEIMNESQTMSLKSLRNERSGCQPVPLRNLCQKSGSSFVSKNDQGTSHMQALRPQTGHSFEYNTSALCKRESHFPSVLPVAPAATETSSREFHFQPEGVAQNPAEGVNYHIFLGDSSFAVSRPLQKNFTGLASQVVPHRFNLGEHRFDSGRTAVPLCRPVEGNKLSSILASKEHLSNANLKNLEREDSNSHNHSALFVCKNKMDNNSISGKSVTPYIRQANASLILNDPSTSNNHSPVFDGEQYQRMQNSSGIGLLPCQSSPPELTKTEKLCHGSCMQQRMPCSVHDVETMRIQTSMEGLAGGPTRFSQTTCSLLITKKTDINFCKENQMFRESRVSTQLKGNAFSELHSLSPFFAHGQRGAKLLSLGSSTDSEGKENIEDVKGSEVVPKNESSAETDTMDMDSFKEKNRLSGVNSSPSYKDTMVDPTGPPQATTASTGEEVGCTRSVTMLPDINLELPALPPAVNSMDNAEPGASRTESLDMELLLSHAEQPNNFTSNRFPDKPTGPESSSRWVKRLKLGASDSFALGTRGSNLGEASTRELTSGKRHGKELMALDQTTASLRNGESSSVNGVKNDEDITLSHSWIQRWRRNPDATPRKKPEAPVACEPQSSKVASMGDFRKPQFPSIAAMALMGKSMSGFQPCDFRRRGSFVVWNN